jgi:four helix bundle protein
MVERFDDLRVYQQAFGLAMRIFTLSRGWPKEELYSLTSEIRRSSRSVCANIAEAWKKRGYVAHFVSKLSYADAEAGETQNWLRFAKDCGYIADHDYEALLREYNAVSGGLVKMMVEAQSWCGPSST